MTLRDLKDAIAAIRLHDLASTNVNAVEAVGTDLILRFDESETEAALTDAREELADANKECEELKAENDKLDAEANRLTAILSGIKNDGGTALDYANRATQAEHAADEANENARRLEVETKALRKRRGIEAGYFANASAVIDYLRKSQEPDARAIMAKINAAK